MKIINKIIKIIFFQFIMAIGSRQPINAQTLNLEKISTTYDTSIPFQNKVILDTIRLKDRRLNTTFLKPGLKQYLVYSQDPKKNRTLDFWFWIRNTKIIIYNGERCFETIQHWYGNDSIKYRVISSINKVSNYAPVFFSELVANKMKAYNWYQEKIEGSDSIYKNEQKGFLLKFKEPNFNWNLDIETFEMLPLAEGKVFAINFYDAGLNPPEYIIYKIIGSDVVKTYDKVELECWMLYTDGTHNGKFYSETFWISKRTHEFLKEVDFFNGMYRYKLALPDSTPNILGKFIK